MKEFISLSQSLFYRHQVKAFRFVRVFDDGTCFGSCTDERISDYLNRNKCHISAHIPIEWVKDRFWYFLSDSGEYSQVMRDYQNMFKVGSVLDYFERKKGYFDLYAFYSQERSIAGANYFIENQGSLLEFVHNFKDSSQALIGRLQGEKVLLSSEMLPNFKGLTD